MSNVVEFTGRTTNNLDADRTLENLKGIFEGFVLVGVDKDGNQRFHSTFSSGDRVLWLLESFKTKLMAGEFDND